GPGYAVGMGWGYLPNPTDMLGGWAPGVLPQRLPEGVGKKLPQGAEVVLQIHYHRTGKEERDRTRLGIYFAKGPVREQVQTAAVPGFFVRIPAGESSFTIDRTSRVNDDVTLYWLTPHMHLLGKSIELTATYPDGRTETLVRVHDWDYNWQEMY